jgi:hypothetical protein
MNNRVALLMTLLVAAVAARCAAPLAENGGLDGVAAARPADPSLLRSRVPLELMGGPDVATLTFRRESVDGADYFSVLVDRGAPDYATEVQLPAMFEPGPDGCRVTIADGQGACVSFVVPGADRGIATSLLLDTIRVEADQGEGRLGVLRIVWNWLDSGELMLSLGTTLYGARRALFFRETIEEAGPVRLTLKKIQSSAEGSLWRT